MAQINKGLFFEFDNRDEAQTFVDARSHLKAFQLGKVYRLEDDWWIVSFDIKKPGNESEENVNQIDWKVVFDNLSKADLSYSKPDIGKGKHQEEVQLGSNSFGTVFQDCPMSNRDALPLFIRFFSYKYKYVLLVLEPKTFEFKFMITHETFLLKSYMCAFKNDGSHINFGPVSKSITKGDFVKIATKICQDGF